MISLESNGDINGLPDKDRLPLVSSRMQNRFAGIFLLYSFIWLFPSVGHYFEEIIWVEFRKSKYLLMLKRIFRVGFEKT